MTEDKDALSSECIRAGCRVPSEHCWVLSSHQHPLVISSVQVSRSIKTLNLEGGVEGGREVEIEKHHHVPVPAWLRWWSQTRRQPTECSHNSRNLVTSQTVTVILFSAFMCSGMYQLAFTFSCSWSDSKACFAAKRVCPLDRDTNLQAVQPRNGVGRGVGTLPYLPFLLMLSG